MTLTTMSSRQFNQDTTCAKKAAKNGPVIITHRGRPSYVLVTIDAYQKLVSAELSIADALALDVDIPLETTPTRDLAQGIEFD